MKILNIENRIVDQMQERTARYPDALKKLEKKNNIFAEIDRI